MLRRCPRLLLLAATPDLLKAELASLSSLGRLLNAMIPPGWPPGEYDRQAQEFFLERLQHGTEELVGWYSWYAIHPNRVSRTLIGAGGFFGPPDEGGFVEIGFSIHPDWYRQGFAIELAGELVAFAFEHHDVRAIVGNTTRMNIASCKVLGRLGFTEAEANQNDNEVLFVLPRASARLTSKST